MINANDGGANISLNGGESWTRSDDHQPLGQFGQSQVQDVA